MNLRELAFQLSTVTLIADVAKEAKDRLRHEFALALDEVGADAAKAILEGEEIAKVSLIQPRSQAEIISEGAFLRWVKENYAFEIVESVRESFRKHLLESLENVDGRAIYPRTGEVLDFIEFQSRDPYIKTRFTGRGRETLTDALRSGSLGSASIIGDEFLMAVGE
jgi:hypothetical protein